MSILKPTWALLWLIACALGVPAVADDVAQSLINDLHSDNVDARRSAAIRIAAADQAIGRIALPTLIDRLQHETDGQVRLAVFDALTALGPQAAPAVPALLETLRTDVGGSGEEATHQDYRAALALAAVGKPAVEGLRALLKKSPPSVRACVVMSLGKIGPDAAAAVPDLVPMLADPSDRVAREAARSLGQMGTAAVEPLIRASADHEGATRAGAVLSLGFLSACDGRVTPAILACARDALPTVRAAAITSLARCDVPDEALAAVVLENLRHESESVRLAVVNLLVERRPLLMKVAPTLESLLTAENDGVARHAAFLLGSIGESAVPHLMGALPRDGSRIEPVAQALASIGRPAAAPLVLALTSSDPRTRRGATRALGYMRPVVTGAVEKLSQGLDDRDRDVRADTLAAIGDLGPRAKACAPKVRSLLRDPSSEIRLAAIRILFTLAPEDDRLLADLIPLVTDADPRVQRQAIDTVRALGPAGRKALGVVISRLESPDPDVRRAAAEMIGSHGPAAAQAVPALGALLEDPSPKLRMVAAETLGKLGKAAQPTVPRLAQLLGADQIELREAATTAIGSLELDPEAARPHLARALRDQKSEVRRAAMKSIQRFGPQGALFVPDLISLAESKDNLRSVERMLRRFERAGPDPRSLPELIKQLQNDHESVRLLAIKFLALAGPTAKDAIPALERMRDDPNALVRKEAQSATEKIKKKRDAH